MGLFLYVFAHGSIVGRWGSFAGMLEYLIAAMIWIIWASHFVWAIKRQTTARGKRISSWALIPGGLLASLFVASLVCHVGGLMRFREIKASVDAGLYRDCMQLLCNWPVQESRIFSTSPEFAQLPASIKKLKPIYVTNDHLNSGDIPPNVGICKNGFGGFAMGVRVFRNDKEANNFREMALGGCQRIAPCVFFWWHPT